MESFQENPRGQSTDRKPQEVGLSLCFLGPNRGLWTRCWCPVRTREAVTDAPAEPSPGRGAITLIRSPGPSPHRANSPGGRADSSELTACRRQAVLRLEAPALEAQTPRRPKCWGASVLGNTSLSLCHAVWGLSAVVDRLSFLGDFRWWKLLALPADSAVTF